jgi:glycosyltransferase involved in cell wall biosynthesis
MDFELLISDNASTDSTEKICLDYASRDKRIKYIRHEANMGLENNYMFVVNEACTDLFMWASYDDIWKSGFIEKLVPAFSNPDVVSVFCPVDEIDEKGNVLQFGLRNIYPTSNLLFRIYKFWLNTKESRDLILYGIHKTVIFKGLILKPFRWPNNDRPDGVGDYIANHILACGKYFFVDGESHFLRRVTLNPPRKQNHTKRGVVSELIHAFTLDIQMSYRSWISIWNCTKSFNNFILTTPVFIIYIVKVNFFRIYKLIKYYLKKNRINCFN